MKPQQLNVGVASCGSSRSARLPRCLRRHSAFYGTPLEFMLEEIGAKTLILAGVAADACITITALDAHVRKFKLWVPRDCVAAQSPAYTRAALAHLGRVADASTALSTS